MIGRILDPIGGGCVYRPLLRVVIYAIPPPFTLLTYFAGGGREISATLYFTVLRFLRCDIHMSPVSQEIFRRYLYHSLLLYLPLFLSLFSTHYVIPSLRMLCRSSLFNL